MNLKSLFLALLFFSLTPAFSQNTTGVFSVKGIITDSATQRPVDLATVSLKNAAKQAVKSAVTKTGGQFVFEKLSTGKYTVTVIALGYTSKIITADLTDSSKPVLDLGAIVINPQSNKLKEVVIAADKPLIKQDIDKLSYDIQADPESKVNNVLEMMRKVPLLSVDADDNIMLKGNANFKILINGRSSGMMDNSAKDVLKSMPAANIQSIEVITNPSSKYDSEGLGGIINIITYKKADNGYNGNLGISERQPVGGPGISGLLNLKEGRLGVTVTGSYNEGHNPLIRSSNNRLTLGNSPASLIQNTTNEWDSGSKFLNTDLSYELDSLNLISVSLGASSNYSDGTIKIYSVLSNNASVLQHYDLNDKGDRTTTGYDAALNYQLGFRADKSRLLTFSYKYTSYGYDDFHHLTASNILNYTTPDYKQFNSGGSSEQTFQADYVHPVKKLNIEAGIKGILRDNDSDYHLNSFNSSSGDFVLDPARSNIFNNKQNVYGAYNTYSYNLKDWGFKAGIRIEGTYINANFVSTASAIRKNYFNITPSIAVNRKFKKMQSMNFGFIQRIQRPSLNLLNPFVNRTNPNFLSTGNPDLRPPLTNSFQIGYTKIKKGTTNLNLDFDFLSYLIRQVSVYDAATDVTTTIWQNLGKSSRVNMSINVSYPISKQWSFNTSVNSNYAVYKGLVNGARIRTDGTSATFNVGSGYRIDKGGIRINASYSYRTSLISSLQAKSNSYQTSSFSISKTAAKDKLTFSFATGNPFNKYYTSIIESSGVNFLQIVNSQRFYRLYAATVNYRFGKLKDAIKKNRRGITNDDVTGG